MDHTELARMIDHTFLKAFGSPADIEKLCAEAREWGFGAVCVHPCNIERCVDLLAGSPVRVCTVAGFPLGQMSSTAKAFEIRDSLDRGAQEIDLVVNVRAVQAGDEELVRTELGNLVEAGVDFVKTSTGFGTGGATVADVRLMKETVGDDAEVKAAGGIRTYEDAVAMIEAGATRIGASSGVAIIRRAIELGL